MRRLFTLGALAALAAMSVSISPAEAKSSFWDHNGSKMTFEEDGEKRRFVYTEPKEGLDKAGIRPGTVLFDGKRKPDGRFAGFAKIFRGGCNPVDYFVEGAHDERKGEIVLQGQAPVYGEKGCDVAAYSDSSPASMLTFSYLGPAAEEGAVARVEPQDQIEQGDRSPENDGAYLPPRGNQQGYAGGDQADEEPAPRRRAVPPRFGEDSDRDYYYPPRERRYSRGPENYDESYYRRRRLERLLDPDYDYEDEETYEEDDAPPYPNYWRRRLY